MEKIEAIKNTLENILGFIDVKYSLEVVEKEENCFEASIEGENLSFLIGYRGESLEALQTLTGLIVFKTVNEWVQVHVDINGYRKQKIEKLEEITKNYIDRVRFLGKDIEMPPMSPSERKQVHVFISQYDDVSSESTGEGSQRRIVLKLKR